MRKRASSFGLMFLLAALAALPSPARAEVPPATTGKDDAPTRLEFNASAMVLPLTPEEQPKGPFDGRAAMLAKAIRSATANAVKATTDLAAQYPKCRFRIASIMPPPPETNPNAPPPPLDAITVRVTLLGESGCLTAGK
jgi:hypothetical protein